MKLNRPGIWLVGLSLAAFIFGMAGLFRDRLEAGDIYPAYSTLRSDPLGCRAFFSALERYPDITVQRAYARADFHGQKPGAAYFFLGLDAESLADAGETLKELDSLARQGHRVVLSFAELAMDKDAAYRMKRAGLMHRDSASEKADSVARDSSIASIVKKILRDSAEGSKDPNAKQGKAEGPKGKDSAAKAKTEADARKTDPGQGMKPEADASIYLREWGFRLMIDTSFDGSETGEAVATPGMGNRKDTLPWLSALYFDSLKGPWTVLYRRGPLPVAVERAVGSGSIALVSDTYFASNEALFHAHPGRLASRLVAGSDRVFFDERHLGVRQDDAIANLLRRYRLHWMLPSLLLLLGLYVWKGRNLLVPEESGESARAAGPDARSALGGLLRRNLTDTQALEACYGFWKDGKAASAPPSPPSSNPASPLASDAEIKSLLERRRASGKTSLAADYGAIQDILNRRKRT